MADIDKGIGGVAELLKEILGKKGRSGVGSYPDFPMEEVISIFDQDKVYKLGIKQLEKRLGEINNVLKPGGKYISIPRIFGPDFYFESDTAPLDEIIVKSKLKTAADLITQS